MIFRFLAGHLEEVLGALLLAAMAFLALANVITRYIFHYPLAFTEELEVNALVWLTLFGTSLAFKRKHHLRMLFFQDKLPENTRKWLNMGLNMVAIALFATLGYLGWKQLLDERFLEITSESLGVPQWIYTCSIPLGCGLVIIRLLQVSIADLREG